MLSDAFCEPNLDHAAKTLFTPSSNAIRKRSSGSASSSHPAADSSSSQSKRRKKLVQNKQTQAHQHTHNKQQQLCIDFGQRSLGRREQCYLCGMLWLKGDPTDEAAHAAFCASARAGVPFPGWKKERIIEAWPNEPGSPKVVEIRAGDPAPHLAKLEEVKVLMDADMGFAHAPVKVRVHVTRTIESVLAPCTGQRSHARCV